MANRIAATPPKATWSEGRETVSSIKPANSSVTAIIAAPAKRNQSGNQGASHWSRYRVRIKAATIKTPLTTRAPSMSTK